MSIDLLKGCDVSAIQGPNGIPETVWKQMADQGMGFAIMRLLVGNQQWVDGSAQINAQRAKAYGIVPGFYWFAYPLPHLDPIQQVERFVKLIEGIGCMDGELPPTCDAEWPSREEWTKDANGNKVLTYPWQKWGCSPEQIREWLLTALERGEQLTGINWLFYSYRYWLQCIEAQKSPELSKRPLWLADYSFGGKWPTGDQIAGMKVPAPWTQLTMVQHDGNGGLLLPNGVDADFDVLLGGQAALQQLAGEKGNPDAGNQIDPSVLTQVRLDADGLITDDLIAQYRQDRIDQIA